MTSFSYDADQGVLTPLATVSTLPAGCTVKNAPAHVCFAPSGRLDLLSTTAVPPCPAFVGVVPALTSGSKATASG